MFVPENNTQYFEGFNVNSNTDHPNNNINNIQHIHITANNQNMENSGGELAHIMSHANRNFDLVYERLNEIGRGGFSVVYRCKHRATQNIYAVKIIDLRPLRLREKFDPSRLRREVDIMSKLHHPNIIEFVEVFETDDHLYVVMEFAPGRELFDEILSRKFFTENDARPIFKQIASALVHLHSLNIIHRDIKPENILILNRVDENGQPIAKLLDFGLSKHAGLGSMAKTFVGTPCYLAPEVEITAKGEGQTYGLPADCWGLGAVLYVMLVARFPEFDRKNDRVSVKMPEQLWASKSSDVKNLIKSLMTFEPEQRMTAKQSLRHPWLGDLREPASPPPPAPKPPRPVAINTNNDDFSFVDIEDSNSSMSVETPKPLPVSAVHDASFSNAIVVRDSNYCDRFQLTTLLSLQMKLAKCFEELHSLYLDMPEVAAKIRSAAVMCRWQLNESTKMLRKIERTSMAVLEMFPDLELAVDENEPKLAQNFFDTVRQWVAELKVSVQAAQKANQSSLSQIQELVNASAAKHQADLNRNLNTLQFSDLKAVVDKLQDSGHLQNISSTELLDLIMKLFESWRDTGAVKNALPSPVGSVQSTTWQAPPAIVKRVGDNENFNRYRHHNDDDCDDDDDDDDFNQRKIIKQSLSRNKAVNSNEHLQNVLKALYEVDLILEDQGLYWSNTDVILDTLSKKGQHAELFVSFGHNKNLNKRFKERMAEYKSFWENVLSKSSAYLLGIGEPQQLLDKFSTSSSEDIFNFSSMSSAEGQKKSGLGSGFKSMTSLDSLN